MASKYLQKYPVPVGFQQVLADFTREVLRDQPPNIIEYAAKYFQMLEKGEKFEFNSKFNVGKDDKKYQLAYNPKNAEEITKKATSIATKVNDAGQPEKGKKDQQKAAMAESKPEKPAQVQQQKAPKPQAQNVPPELLSELSRIFNEFDLNKNGFIESKEVRAAVESIGAQSGIHQKVNQSEIDEFVQAADTDRDGRISRQEFIDFMANLFAPVIAEFQASYEKQNKPQAAPQKQPQSHANDLPPELINQINRVFNEFDLNKNGFIDSKQIRKAAETLATQGGVHEKVDQNEIDEFVKATDTNRDGKISRQEFVTFMVNLLAPFASALAFDFHGSSEKTVNQQEVETYVDQQATSAMYAQLNVKFEQVFNQVDVDHNGYITTKQLHHAAQLFGSQTGQEPDAAQIAEFIEQVDANNDGKISKEELFQFLVGALMDEEPEQN